MQSLPDTYTPPTQSQLETFWHDSFPAHGGYTPVPVGLSNPADFFRSPARTDDWMLQLERGERQPTRLERVAAQLARDEQRRSLKRLEWQFVGLVAGALLVIVAVLL